MKTAGKIIGGIVAGMLLFFFGLTVGMMGTSHPDATAVTATQPAVVQAPAQPTPAPAPTTQAGVTHPQIAFSDGTYEIGTGDGQVYPGKYKVGAATGGMGNGYTIYDANNKIVKADYTHGPTLMKVTAGQTIQISGGGTWTLVQ